MGKLIAFDLDHTLSDPDKSIEDAVVRELKELENNNVKIAILSGKPSMYVAGVARQLGLKEPIISGENGAFIYYTAIFPPKKYYPLSIENNKLVKLRELHTLILNKFGSNVWIQPNFINFSAFPLNLDIKEDLISFMKDYYDNTITDPSFHFYVHPDNSIEIVPSGINKGIALQKIMEIENIPRESTIAVGNSANDLPMLEEAGTSIGIGYSEATYSFDTILDAIQFIKDLISKKEVEG